MEPYHISHAISATRKDTNPIIVQMTKTKKVTKVSQVSYNSYRSAIKLKMIMPAKRQNNYSLMQRKFKIVTTTAMRNW